MSLLKKSTLDIELSYLICSLYTLSEYASIFKEEIFKNPLFLSIDNKENFLNKSQILLNSPALRRFSVILLNPLIRKSYLTKLAMEKSEASEKIIDNEITLLKRYLRKFKYNYLKYFYQNANFTYIPTPRTINNSAIKALFLIVGI